MLKHAKVKTYNTRDNQTEITTESYADELVSTKQEVELKIKTSIDRLMADTISCLDVMKNGTSNQLNINIRYLRGSLVITKTFKVSGKVY